MKSVTLKSLVAFTFLATSVAIAPKRAEACSPPFYPALPEVTPKAAATDVPLDVSIVGFGDQASSVVLHEGDTVVPLGDVVEIASGAQSFRFAHGWRRKPSQALKPETEYVVTAVGRNGGADAEISRFRTGTRATSSAVAAAAPSNVKFVRVHTPKEYVQSSNCIFAEYTSSVSLTVGTPTQGGTPDDGFYHVLRVTTEAGEPAGTSVAHAFSSPLTQLDFGTSDLTPGARYCLAVETHGYGDTVATSERVCGLLEERENTSVGPRDTGESGAQTDTITPPDDTIATAPTSATPNANADDGGCSASPGGSRDASDLALTAFAGLAFFGIARRKKTGAVGGGVR